MLTNNNKLFCQKKNFLCVWRCPIGHSKTFFLAKCFIIFLQHPWKIIFEPIQYLWANNALILLQKCISYCKAPTNQHAFFISLKKDWVCSVGHLNIHWNFFSAKYFIIFFQRSWKMCFISIQIFYFNNTQMLSQNIIYFCKGL